jgi:predicted acylesterase/phospholipase RssA
LRNGKRQTLLPLLLLAVFLLAACAHYPGNEALKDPAGNDPYKFSRYNKPANADTLFIAVTFSGGGTRAAALAYGVLEQLRETTVPGAGKSLLDEVDVISTVSGGSFTGAYYALFGDRIFTDFKQVFLYRNIERELTHKLANPVNWYRLASPYFSRIDLAAELYDSTVFDGKKFFGLTEHPGRPYLIINATNLFQGARFEFSGDQFDYIGSDILSYPVARAVAASSAFPFLLAPISLKNHPSPPGYETSMADKAALEDFWTNRERYVQAVNNTLYEDKSGHPYVHLMDGGLADNIGLRAISDLYVRGGIRQKILNGRIRKFLVIVVNARTEPPQDLDRKESPPGLADVAFKTCTVSMDNYSFETVESFKKQIEERQKAQRDLGACQDLLDKHCRDGYKIPPLAGGDLVLAVADLSFDNLNDKAERDFLKALPTSFKLPKSDVDRLIAAGRRLLRENPDLQRFLSEINQ